MWIYNLILSFLITSFKAFICLLLSCSSSMIFEALSIWSWLCEFKLFAWPYLNPPFCVTLQSNLVSPHYFIQGHYLSPAFTSSILDVFVLWVCVQTISNIIPCFSCLLERFVKFSLMYSFLILSFLVPLHMHISVTSFFSLLHCPTFNII